MSTNNNPAMGEWFARLKSEINLHDLADRLDMQRHGREGNYFSPSRKEKHPSLSIYDNHPKFGNGWKDHAADIGGTTIDLVIYAGRANDPMEAAKLLGEWYAIPRPSREKSAVPERKSTADYIADRCLKDTEPAVAYLTGRGISEEVIRSAIRRRSIGWNTWTSTKVPEGEPGHGGPGVAFIVRSLAGAKVVAVDMRYLDPALNGDVKTQCQGDKRGHVWTSDLARLKRANTVYAVESPINALSIETALANYPGVAAVAILGVSNTDIDWSWARGKKVIVAMDHSDRLDEKYRTRPGMEAAWKVADALTACDIANRLVDMLDWEEGEDINDVLRDHGAEELRIRLKKLDQWLIPGQPSVDADRRHQLEGRRRVFLQGHDLAVYWRFRCLDDFTLYVEEFKERKDDDGSALPPREDFGDLCSFRVAGLSRLRIQSHLATINGMPDNQPETVFGISCQLARNGSHLQREVVTGDKLYNLEWWKAKFGHIWNPAKFARMVNILERSADLAARDVVNFVGLAWRGEELAALEGNDCFFVEPQKQCLYNNMSFPRGSTQNARAVIAAYQATFKENAAAIGLVWGLGAHLKNVLGFYPHFQMQAEKGSGKSKLLESMQATLAFQVLSGQMLKTDHRRRASVSWTTHPVGWDEFSKLPKSILSDIDGLLQSTYRSEFTRVGATLTPYLMCAPVLLAGEEVDVESLQSKICRSSLSVAKQGAIIPHELPQFPVWEWLQFLASVDPARIRDTHKRYVAFCQQRGRAGEGDATAKRMMENYAAIMTAWALLTEFAGIDIGQGDFLEDIIAEMNAHIADTDGTRLPWVWIMEILLSELAAQRFDHPYCWGDHAIDGRKLAAKKQDNKDWLADVADGEENECLFVMPSHVMDHLSTAPHLRAKFDHLPVKTGRIFKRQLLQSGVVVDPDCEKTIRRGRQGHMVAISISKLAQLGLHAAPVIDRGAY
ncbi:toprim domain-containing protein [Pseudogulbenkiania sp. MAI-1]|uniref:toprim domain-containing protein n=1 Tax=Pseudogulbenkiania sp. MAI-1 TaxID=990370 RepID=UPI00045E842A|nr:toprim domain-containing protein [Pseudogulbenkiania sp. MAI-1]